MDSRFRRVVQPSATRHANTVRTRRSSVPTEIHHPHVARLASRDALLTQRRADPPITNHGAPDITRPPRKAHAPDSARLRTP